MEELLSAIYGGNDETVLIGAVSEDEWWEVVQERLRLPKATVTQLRLELLETYDWDDELVAFLRSLRGLVPTALVSNAWPRTLDRLVHHGLGDIVDEFVISGAVGFRKPDRRIYQLALDRLRVHPSDAIFVDDSPEYVAAAHSLGISGHIHGDAAATIQAIKRFMGPLIEPSVSRRGV